MKLNEYLGNDKDYSDIDLEIMEVVDKENCNNNFFVGLGKTKDDKFMVMTSSHLSRIVTTQAVIKSREDAVNFIANMVTMMCI